MLYNLAFCAICVFMRIYTECINSVLHGTEPLEQNYVPVHTRAQGTISINSFCKMEEEPQQSLNTLNPY